MRQDFFQYNPQFKLFVSGNHKPKLRSVNKAVSRRIKLLPFIFTIPDNKKILNLAQKLVAEEGAGILAWMIAGCLDYQENGLVSPEVVTKATGEYLAKEDVLQGKQSSQVFSIAIGKGGQRNGMSLLARIKTLLGR